MNTPVSFELAKLLKEKGFDEPCSHAYKEVENPVLYIHQDKKYNNSFEKEWQNTVRKNSHMKNAAINRYSAPTIAEVVMWLCEEYGVWITVTSISQESWQCHMTKKGDSLGKCYLEDFYNPTEAYEAAIEYCLNDLI